MKTFELTLQLRNNHLKARRDELGLGIVAFCKRAGVEHGNYSRLERMIDSPIGRGSGFGGVVGWRRIALKLARFHGASPEDLFPAAVQQIHKSKAVLLLDADELAQLAGAEQLDELPSDLLTPEEALIAKETAQIVHQHVRSDLPPRERKILSARFVLDENLREVGARHGVCPERVRQIERRALRKLAGPAYRIKGTTLRMRVRDGEI